MSGVWNDWHNSGHARTALGPKYRSIYGSSKSRKPGELLCLSQMALWYLGDGDIKADIDYHYDIDDSPFPPVG